MSAMDRPDLKYPKLRAVEVHPIEQEGGSMVILKDPLQLAEGMLMVPPLLFFALTFFDGKHSIPQIQEEVKRQTGIRIPTDNMEEMILRLDQHFFLHSSAFQKAYQEMMDAFHASPVRPPAHAETVYETEPEVLKNHLQTYMNAIQSEPRPPCQTPLRLLIAPHIDIQRGGIGFAHAYREILHDEPADLYVVFGTAHQSQTSFLTLTRKSYDTPLGLMPTDVPFVEEFSRRISLDGFEEEILHRSEHSIEFQMLWLRYVLDQPWQGQVVPILCGSLHEFIEDGTSPLDHAPLRQALDTLRDMIFAYPGRVVVIAGVDFSHVGMRFGSEEGVPPKVIQRVKREDCAILDALVRGEADTFFAAVQKNKDRNNLCGLSPIFMALYVVQPSPGTVLHYDMSVEDENESLVSFASLRY